MRHTQFWAKTVLTSVLFVLAAVFLFADDTSDKLVYAAKHNKAGEVRRLLQEVSTPDMLSEGWTALMRAADSGNAEITNLLLNAEADTNIGGIRNRTAILWAAYSENANPAVIQQLLNNGADPDKADDDGWTALMAASFKGNTTIVRLLLSVGAEVDSQNNKGQTALILAAGKTHSEVVHLLTNAGADTEHLDSDGNSALMEATRSIDSSTIQNLLRAGANPNTKNPNDGVSPLSLAEDKDNESIIKMLKNAGGQ